MHADDKRTRFAIVGGPDAFIPDYALALQALVQSCGLGGVLTFLGDRKDVPHSSRRSTYSPGYQKARGCPMSLPRRGAAGLPVNRDSRQRRQAAD